MGEAANPSGVSLFTNCLEEVFSETGRVPASHVSRKYAVRGGVDEPSRLLPHEEVTHEEVKPSS